MAATCRLLSERGFEATSPVMIQQRSGVGQGSRYHHFPGKGKEGLALDAISHMRASTLAFLDGTPTPQGAEVEAVREHIVAALDRLFDRREGQALIRLMADGVAGAIKPLAQATRDWCDDIRATIVVMLRADDPAEDSGVADAAASFLAPEFEHLAEELFTAALGRGLVRLPKIALYLFPDREEALSDLKTIPYGVVRSSTCKRRAPSEVDRSAGGNWSGYSRLGKCCAPTWHEP